MEGNAATVRRLVGDALGHHQAGRLTEAEQLYRQILAIDARHADSWHLLGVIALQTGRPAVAAELIGKAVAIKSTVAVYHSNLGSALKDLGRLDDAAAHCKRAIALNPNFTEAHNNLGNVLKDQDQLDEARAAYERALALNPKFAEAHNNLGNVFKDLEKPERAVTNYERAIELKPDYAQANFNLGNVLKALDKLDEAAARYERALALNPKLAEAHNNLGNVLRDQGKPDQAVTHYRQALLLNPNYAQAHFNLGNAFQEMDKLDDAAACYKQALALDPKFAEAHNNLGNVLKALVQFDAAAACYEKAAALKPEFIEARYNLGDLFIERGAFEKARMCFERILELRPDNAVALGGLGNAHLAAGRIDEAHRFFGRAYQLQPLNKRAGINPKANFSVLMLNAPGAGNTPSGYLVDCAGYDSYFLGLLDDVEYDLKLLRGVGNVVVNLVSDADRGRAILPLAIDLVERLGRPVINHPRRILQTGREAIAARLAGLPHCRIPKTARVSLALPDIRGALAGYELPLLVRPTGAHGGDEFEKLADFDAISGFVRRTPNADHYVSEYVPYESADGYFRKYRLIFVDGHVFPYHLAIADQWKVHYFRTDMAHHEWMRKEEEAFIADPDRVFRPEHWDALRAIPAAVGLDYFGIDCSFDHAGNLLVFEINATMLVHGEKTLFAYKAPYIARIKQAFDAMLAKRAREA